MGRLSSYSKVFNLGHAAIADLFLDPVVVEEKLDGSQISFGLVDGELIIRSHRQQLTVEAPDKMFAIGVDAIKSMAADLHPGWTYRGEYLQKPHHNVLAYDRVPFNHIMLFDIDTGNEAYLMPDEKEDEAIRIRLEVVPMLFSGMIGDLAQLDELLLELPSTLGRQLAEGLVIKNYKRFGIDGKCLMGKRVRESYKEIHDSDWRKRHPTQGDVIQELIRGLRTPARWDKAVIHLKEDGRLLGEPADIGPLIKEVVEDVKAECEELIKERLFAYAWKEIGRKVTVGLPEWYKDKLAQAQFADVGDDGENS